jgi:hypothetical protein
MCARSANMRRTPAMLLLFFKGKQEQGKGIEGKNRPIAAFFHPRQPKPCQAQENAPMTSKSAFLAMLAFTSLPAMCGGTSRESRLDFNKKTNIQSYMQCIIAHFNI